MELIPALLTFIVYACVIGLVALGVVWVIRFLGLPLPPIVEKVVQVIALCLILLMAYRIFVSGGVPMIMVR